ncbi:MAG: ABC transporter substrate-binding protein [Pirellulales bacterium]
MTDALRRIVCLTAESFDLFDRLGASHLVAGVSAYSSDLPHARGKTIVSAFTTVRYDVIDALEPDLVVGFSDLQAEAAAELGRRGHNVLLTNQRSVNDILRTCRLLGRAAGLTEVSEPFVDELERRWRDSRAEAASRRDQPRVYFEEWDEPLISGIAWVGELIEAAGGVDIFADRRAGKAASERIVTSEEVLARRPDVILASWCGKPVCLDSIAARPGWHALPAVQRRALHELPGRLCLQPGPTLLLEGLPAIQGLLHQP